jgi:hypothetical protein
MTDQNNHYEANNKYLKDDDNTSPFVLTGLSGSDKSSPYNYTQKMVGLGMSLESIPTLTTHTQNPC